VERDHPKPIRAEPTFQGLHDPAGLHEALNENHSIAGQRAVIPSPFRIADVVTQAADVAGDAATELTKQT